MPTLPEPPTPGELARIRLEDGDTPVLAAGTLLWRIYFLGGPHRQRWNTFRTFGPTDSRFDHHLEPQRGQARGILYAARDGATCFAEAFQRTRTINRTRRRPWLVGFRLARGVPVLSLAGNWPTRAGASMAINSASRARARRWSRAIYDAYPKVQGLLYCSKMNRNEPALALYERAERALPESPEFNRPLNDPGLAGPILAAARRLGYLVLP